MSVSPIKPTHKAIQAYYDALKAYGTQDVEHETALRSAFQNLLQVTGHEKKWTLIPELSLKLGGKLVRPDGTLRDEWHLPRGYWEAKDTGDDLDAEIKKKAARGYPLSNTIFEDTRNAILYQNGAESVRIPLSDPGKLADLLTAFYSYTTPDYEGFNEAVSAFKERIPDLARGLAEKIAQAHKKNKKFIDAFADFLDLCKTSLNPNIRVEAVDEMLVQHLLTERLFRTIFQNADFTRRNVIAAEIEKVIDALTIGSFSRAEFLKSLDVFYLAIEGAAATIEDFSQKQHFLNTVYERFFQGYSVKLADTHGIVYTPQAIVDFMCASVAEALKSEFGKGLGDEGVTILDPCTGTGNFIVNLMRRIPKRDLPRAYREQLFANEVMLLPYYIAAMNIEHEYYDLTGNYEPFAGLCFVDTLELAEGKQRRLAFMSKENSERVERQARTPITVVIGNPPYNVGQLDENDNNKNRKYEVIDQRIRETYTRDSRASNKNALSDMFVKFFRWASDRLGNRDGIIAFVSNNSFVHSISFDGLRKHLTKEYDSIYHFDTRGNGRLIGARRTLDGRNVFDDSVRVGVGITLLIRRRSARQASGCAIRYHAVGDRMKTREKLAYLRTFPSVADVPWTELTPDARHDWIVPTDAEEFAALMPIGDRATKASNDTTHGVILKDYGRGLATSRDSVVYDFDRDRLVAKVQEFIEAYHYEVYRYGKHGEGTPIDEFVSYEKVAWSEGLKKALARGNQITYDDARIRRTTYRPFISKALYFDRLLNERVYQFPIIFPTPATEAENRAIVVSDIGFRSPQFNALMCDRIVDLHLTAASDSHQCFPFYVYDEDGTNRRENITDWALEAFRSHYGPRGLPEEAGTDALIRPPGTFSRGEKGGTDPHLSPRERSDALRPGEGPPDSRGDVPDALIRPSGTFSRGEKGDGRKSAQGEGGIRAAAHVALDPDLLAFARKLRGEQTEPEQFLWAVLRNRRLAGAKFRRQYPVDPYVLDFYCHAAKLAIELDGGQHNSDDGRRKDDRRSRFLTDRGITVLRFWNYQVFEETETVLETIVLALEKGTAPPSLLPPGGGARRADEGTRPDIDPADIDPAEEGPLTRTNGVRPPPPGEVKTTPNHPIVDEPRGRSDTPGRPISKWDIFYYVYGVLHHPEYRTTFADNLKRELPRIPFMDDFEAFAAAGRSLAKWHLEYESIEPWPLTWVEVEGVPLSYEVTRMKLSKDRESLRVNDWLTLEGIPPEVSRYRLGNRSALEWVVDQYQVSEDALSGIRSDPNRTDDPEYIVRLVGQVVRVSVETVKIVESLPNGLGVGLSGE